MWQSDLALSCVRQGRLAWHACWRMLQPPLLHRLSSQTLTACLQATKTATPAAVEAEHEPSSEELAGADALLLLANTAALTPEMAIKVGCGSLTRR